MRWKAVVSQCILQICILTFVHSQKDILSTTIQLPSTTKPETRKDYLKWLSEQLNLTFSYNASLLRDDIPARPDITSGNLSAILEAIFAPDKIQLIPISANKILLQSRGIKKKEWKLSGRISDQLTGESIFGAVVHERHSNISVLTNEKGYYIIDLPTGQSVIEVRYIGYKTAQKSLNMESSATLDITLVNDNLLDTIYIADPKTLIQLTDGGNIVDVFKTKEYKSIIGEIDLVNNARILPGVQSGGEGQSGLYVRGGTPDQNLILLDGVALYETTHIAGISSIFMEESIKEASFVKNGFPARYGGRLSGVMDIQLRDGDKHQQHTQLSAGIAGAKIHLNGPIMSDKTTYSITARSSWLNFYVNNLLRKFTKYDDIQLAYTDVIGKFSHYFSPSNSLSFTFYTGNDRLQLTKENLLTGQDFQLKVFDRNGLNWGNTLASLKWNVLLTDKISLKVQTGWITYKNGSRSSYRFNTITPDSTKTDELDVITRSNIQDVNLRADLEYYLSDQHVIRAGTNVLQQRFNPTIRQSTLILEGNAENVLDKDSLIRCQQLQWYVEDNFKINTSLFLYGGLHISTFRQDNTTYSSWQPRFKVIWTPFEKHMFSAAFSKMTQYLHLLSNSGLGLPSDLWVPSTGTIKPQHSRQWSANYTYHIQPGLYTSIGSYTRQFSNSLEYTSPVELFYFLINNQNIVPVYNKSRDWERNLLVGSTKSKGLEFLLHKNQGNFKGWSSVTWSKTEKTFPGLNKGFPFPANHDRTWDINIGLNRKFSQAFSSGVSFVYGTGNTFSLATEEYDSALGITLLRASERNNYRLPPFHHLSFNASYSIKNKLTETILELNIYNVYNRLNAYFIYIYENPTPPYNRYLRKVSILPFTPSLSVSIKF